VIKITNRPLNFISGAICLIGLSFTSPTLAQSDSMEDVVRAANALDFKQAYKLLEEAAASGNAQAEGFLAYVLSIGEWHVPVDKKRAEKLLKSAADMGDGYANLYLYAMNEPNAEINPGDLFVPSNDYEANLQAALGAGNSLAQTTWAFSLREEKEYAESYIWFEKAATNGSVIAKAMQAFIEDVEHYPSAKSPARLKELASTGYPLVNLGIAAFYSQGRGVARDWELALKYVTNAHLFLGSGEDQDLSEFEKKLSKEEIHRARTEAEAMMFRWAKGPNTHLAIPAIWCETEGYWNRECISNALFSHEACMSPFQNFEFQNPSAYPGYYKCRYEASISPYF